MPLGIDFWKDFGGFWMPKWSKVESKMWSKIDFNFERRFFKKLYFSIGKIRFFEIQQVQVGSKNRPKIDQKIECELQCILASIFERFLWILGAKLGLSWSHVGHLSRPRTTQDPSKTPPKRLQGGPRCLERRFGSPKTAEEASKPAPKPSRPRLWTIFDWCLVHF